MSEPQTLAPADAAVIESVRLIHLEEGDRLVVSCKERMSLHAMERLSEALAARFPQLAGTGRILIMDSGLELTVLRGAGDESAQPVTRDVYVAE